MTKVKEEMYGPVGRCIYCGTTDAQLTKEHIVPANFGGPMVLLDASCIECADLINKTIEQPLLQRTFGKIRYQRQIGSRNLKSRPDELPILVRKEELEITHDTDLRVLDRSQYDSEFRSLDDHPMFLVLPVYDPPSMTKGDEIVSYSEKHVRGDVSLTGGAKSKRSITSTYVEVPIDYLLFLRFLAKIAHGYGVLMFGLNGFRPFLTDIVTGKDVSTAAHYIGASSQSLPDSNMPFSIGHGLAVRRGEPLVFVDFRLFPDLEKTPTYRAVVGKFIKNGGGFQTYAGK